MDPLRKPLGLMIAVLAALVGLVLFYLAHTAWAAHEEIAISGAYALLAFGTAWGYWTLRDSGRQNGANASPD